MKKVLFALCLLTGTLAATSVKSYAQSYSVTVTVTGFTAKVNLMDSLISAGSMTAAATTWNEIHDMLMAELGNTKAEIAGATTALSRSTYQTTSDNQWALYNQIWALKDDLATNRAAIKAKLLAFAGTI